VWHSTTVSMLLIFPILLEKFKLSQLETGLCYIPFGVMAITGSKIGGLMSDKIGAIYGLGGRMMMSLYGVLLYILASVQFGLSSTLWVVIVSASLLGLFLTLQRPGIYAYVIQQYPNNSSAVSAILLFVQFTLGFISITIAPLIWEQSDTGKIWYYGGTAILTAVSAPLLISEIIRSWRAT